VELDGPAARSLVDEADARDGTGIDMSGERKRSWRAFFAGLTEAERQDIRDVLLEDYAAEIDMADQLRRHAKRLRRHEEHRARLLAIAAREQEHARWLREAIERLGGQAPEVPPVPQDAETTWERLMIDLNAEKDAHEKLLRDAFALVRIAEEEEAHQREIAQLLARVDRAALDSKP
jgi:bacterioferritin (cytochrome b1)